MHYRHLKIYYVGGLLSLMLLPAIFFIATTRQRSNATEYRGFYFELPPSGSSCTLYYYPQTVYEFVGDNEIAKLGNFKEYCSHIDRYSTFNLIIPVSKNCSYNFYIQLLDIVQLDRFQYNIGTNIIACHFPAKAIPEMYIDNPNKVSDFEYTISFVTRELSELKTEIVGYTVHLMPYTDLGPPPSVQRAQEEPMIAPLLSVLGLWTLYIFLAWCFLFIVSIKRARRQLLPNQRLKLTETAVGESAAR